MDDGYAWHQKLDDEWREFEKRFGQLGRDSAINKFVSSFRGEKDCYTVKVYGGSFKFSAQVRSDDGEQWIIRFSRPGSHMYLDGTVLCEVATIRFMQEKTSVPIVASSGSLGTLRCLKGSDRCLMGTVRCLIGRHTSLPNVQWLVAAMTHS
jgi:hypothetical protein